MTSPLFRWSLGSAVLGGVLLLGACSSNDDRNAFLPVPTPTGTATPAPTPTPVFMGSSAEFIDFLQAQPVNGDPFPVNDGAVQFTDTAGNTDPVPVN